LATQIIRQQTMYDLINGLMSFLSDLSESGLNQDSTADLVSDNPGFTTLATFTTGKLLGFSMKLLDLPTEATRFLYSLCIVLSQVVGNDILHALGS
jgi:hypothetical protein